MQKTSNDMIAFLLTTTLLILVIGGFVLTLLYQYRKKQIAYIKSLARIQTDNEENLLRTQLEIQEQTFRSISREIHDNVNLSLTLAKLNLNMITADIPSKAKDHVSSSIGLVSKAIVDLTDISRSMNPDVIIEQGLITALQHEISRFRELNQFRITLNVAGQSLFMDSQSELFVFRIIQEALNNILKHARASKVGIYLNYKVNEFEVVVTDNGIGFRTLGDRVPSRNTAGLKNMEKRAEYLNGKFSITSILGKGTEIRILIPMKDGK